MYWKISASQSLNRITIQNITWITSQSFRTNQLANNNITNFHDHITQQNNNKLVAADHGGRGRGRGGGRKWGGGVGGGEAGLGDRYKAPKGVYEGGVGPNRAIRAKGRNCLQ